MDNQIQGDSNWAPKFARWYVTLRRSFVSANGTTYDALGHCNPFRRLAFWALRLDWVDGRAQVMADAFGNLPTTAKRGIDPDRTENPDINREPERRRSNF